MKRYCLSYNRESVLRPEHVPGGPAHARGHRLIEVRPDQLDLARKAFPDGDPSMSVIEMPEGEHDTINVAEWSPAHWARIQLKYGGGGSD